MEIYFGSDVHIYRPILRAFIRDDLVEVAKASPDVEFVVRRLKQGKAALLRGHYGKRKGIRVQFGTWRLLTAVDAAAS